MLVQLFRRGPGTPGIFRKPALQRSAKQIRALLDEGMTFNIFFNMLYFKEKRKKIQTLNIFTSDDEVFHTYSH